MDVGTRALKRKKHPGFLSLTLRGSHACLVTPGRCRGPSSVAKPFPIRPKAEAKIEGKAPHKTRSADMGLLSRFAGR